MTLYGRAEPLQLLRVGDPPEHPTQGSQGCLARAIGVARPQGEQALPPGTPTAATPPAPTYFRGLTPVTAPAGPPVPPPNAGALELGTNFIEIPKNQDWKNQPIHSPAPGRSCLTPSSSAGRCWSSQHNKCNPFLKFIHVPSLPEARARFKESKQCKQLSLYCHFQPYRKRHTTNFMGTKEVAAGFSV